MIFRRVKIRLWYVIAFSVLMWGVVSWASFEIGQIYGHHKTHAEWEELYVDIQDVREAVFRCIISRPNFNQGEVNATRKNVLGASSNSVHGVHVRAPIPDGKAARRAAGADYQPGAYQLP